MKNTDCPSPSESAAQVRPLTLLGNTLLCKGYCCARNGGDYAPKPEPLKLQLSIFPANYCPAGCRFCIAADTIRDRSKLDLGRLEDTLWKLQAAQAVRGISISGGEPFTDVPLLNRVINLCFRVFGMHMEINVNTNGMNIQRIFEIEQLSCLEALHISRHHYDDAVNSRIFGYPMPGHEILSHALHSVGCRDLFVLNCMLLKDHIGSAEEVHRYLDFAIEMGAGKVSFITATPVNGYTRAQRVNFSAVLRDEDPRLLFTREYRDYAYCRCRDGVYVSPAGKLIEFYGRETTASGCSYVRGLSYGADNLLRAGYTGPVLLER